MGLISTFLYLRSLKQCAMIEPTRRLSTVHYTNLANTSITFSCSSNKFSTYSEYVFSSRNIGDVYPLAVVRVTGYKSSIVIGTHTSKIFQFVHIRQEYKS